MYKLLCASKSCSNLGTQQLLIRNAIISHCAIPVRRQLSSLDMTREEYLKLKKNFLQQFYEKEQQVQLAIAKLSLLRQRRAKNEMGLLVSINTPVECLNSQNIPESGIKTNCIRATNYITETRTMVAADKLAEGAVQQMEQRFYKRKAKDFYTEVL